MTKKTELLVSTEGGSTALAPVAVPACCMHGLEQRDAQITEARLVQPNSKSNFSPGSLIEYPTEAPIHTAAIPFEPWELGPLAFVHLASRYMSFGDDSSSVSKKVVQLLLK